MYDSETPAFGSGNYYKTAGALPPTFCDKFFSRLNKLLDIFVNS